MTDGHGRKRSNHQDDLNREDKRSSRQSCLNTKIAELIERYETQDKPPRCSTSQSLMIGFVRHIWPEIRDDYRQMTQYLEGELKRVLKEQHIDAELSSRVKEDASITKTLERRQRGLLKSGVSGFKSYQDIFHEMHDLSGLRIVLNNPEDLQKAQKLIQELFHEKKSPAHFNANREVGQLWRRPWFGAYESLNHRVQLANDNRAALGENDQYSGVTFEIQLTKFSDNLYNKLAHDLLYKADPGLVTLQEEMVIDVSHGLARCFELCMRILRPKLHRDSDKKTVGTAVDIGVSTKEEEALAESVVASFEENLRKSESDPVAQQLRFAISNDSLISDSKLIISQETSLRERGR